jgi:hypothetical protein
MDLLLGENIILIAKVSAAAVNHSDQYSSYAIVLGANADDLANLMRRAFGNTAADEFRAHWTAENASFVDYANGVVTHSQDKADAATSALDKESILLADYMASLVAFVDPTRFVSPLRNQVTAVKKVVDDEFAQNFTAMYADLHLAYSSVLDVGDLMATRIAQKFPDKFPGDPSLPSVARRVTVNGLLQEHAYLATMATDAAINGRAAERQQAFAALSANANAIGSALKDGNVGKVWAQEVLAVAAYADHNDAASKKGLTDTFVAQLSSAGHVPANLVTEEAGAIVKVIDDQRAKAYKTVAGDDRAAATAMQPIADAMTA